MAQTVQLPTITEVTVQNTVLDIFTYYNSNFLEFLQFFIIEILGMVGTVPFAEGELGYSIQALPDFSANVNDHGELVVNDDVVDLYFVDNLGYLINGDALASPLADAASNILDTSFTANWEAVDGAMGYCLDVSTDPYFNTYVTGYQNKDVGNVLTEDVTGLTGGVEYYYRVRAYDNNQTSLDSNIVSTTVLTYPLLDKDGNEYHTVILGNYECIIENYKVTQYADGTPITEVTNGAAWAALTAEAFCWFLNSQADKIPFGPLYNWFVISNAHGFPYLERNGVQEVGWDVPTEAQYEEISNLFGGDSVSGIHLKEAGLIHWLDSSDPSTYGDNSSGFTFLPGGYRDTTGAFLIRQWGGAGYFWLKDEYSSNYGKYVNMWYELTSALVDHGVKGSNGFSIRLIRHI